MSFGKSKASDQPPFALEDRGRSRDVRERKIEPHRRVAVKGSDLAPG